MATTVTPIFCRKTLSLKSLWSPKTTLGRGMCTTSGVVGKKTCVCPDPPTLHLRPMQAMHVYLWDAKGSELYMRPLIQQFRDKGIPLTAEPLGFQRLDGWTTVISH